MRQFRLPCLAAAAALGLGVARPCTADGGASFEFLPIREIGARDHDGVTRDSLSPDGTMVALPGVHELSYAAFPGFWSEADGVVYCDVPVGGSEQAAVLQFFDGGVLFGPGGCVLWERGVGLEDMTSVFPTYDSMSSAWGVSADGSTLCGMQWIDDSYELTDAVRWRRDGSANVIESLEANPSGIAGRTSRNGEVVIGEAWGANSAYTTWVWTPEGGRVDLMQFTFAGPLSEDGSTVVVQKHTKTEGRRTHTKVYLWTHDGAVRDLGPEPAPPVPYAEYHDFEPLAISQDGSVLLGTMRVEDENGFEEYTSQFLWTEATGIVDAREYLQDAITSPWPDYPDYRIRIDEVIDISADARRFLVYGNFEVDSPDDDDDGGAPRALHGPCGDDWAQYSCPAFVTLPSACPGDLDRDDDVDTGDFLAFVSNFDTDVWPGTHGDFNRDWRVDVLDFAVLAANFGCRP